MPQRRVPIPAASQRATANNAGQVNPLKDPSSVLSKRIVYFDYDSYTVKDQDRGVCH